MLTRSFRGTLVPLVTPFSSGKLDEERFKGLIEWLIGEGVGGLVPTGTTGESATLSHEEHRRVVELTIEVAQGRVPVVAGTGSNSTREAIELTRHAQKAGADGALLISPYYNKPTQEGLYRHFKAVAEAVNIPIILYNIPGRTGVNIAPATVARTAEIENVIGVKESSGSLDQISETIALCGTDFLLLSGDDSLTLPILSVGGRGAIAASANVVPKDLSNMVRSFLDGEVEKAREIHRRLFTLLKTLFIETNPVPVKTALHLMGKLDLEFRLPLCPMTDANLERLRVVMKDYGLI